VQKHLFREDLYYRLCAFQVHMPALRERPEDIAEIAEDFLDSLATKNKTPRAVIAEETLQELAHRQWHGNVRELRNALEHAVIVARGGTILPEHLPLPVPSPTADNAASLPLEKQIASLIQRWSEQHLQASDASGHLYDAPPSSTTPTNAPPPPET